MKKGLFFTALSMSISLLTGCSTPVVTPPAAPVEAVAAEPQSAPEIVLPPPQTLTADMQKATDAITQAGGLAALGVDKSRSLELALNMAKKNGRLQLANLLDARIETLAKAFSEETGIPYDSLLLSGFNNAARIIIKQQIAGSVAKELKYETTGDKVTAYAVMVLDPKAIADQLAQEPDLYPRLQPTAAFAALNREIETYAAFKAAQK